MPSCRCTAPGELEVLLDLGDQPISNRFLSHAGDAELVHPLVLAQCTRCGLLQLADAAPPEMVRPIFEWIKNTEPEGHVSRLAETIASLPSVTRDSAIYGVSYKDESTLDALRSLGFSKPSALHPRNDLDIESPLARIETVQERLTVPRTARFTQAHGRAQVVICRHILEHAHDALGLLLAVQQLVRPGGYLIIEVPGTSRPLGTFDYSIIWEEHVSYFTEGTLPYLVGRSGLTVFGVEVVSAPLEDVLIVIAQLPVESTPDAAVQVPDTAFERRRARDYAARFPATRDAVQRWLRDYQMRHGKVAILGAGHLGCKFVNLYRLGQQIEFFVDDNPHKQRLFAPGSRLSIRGSQALVDEDIRLCLLSCSPESEPMVLARNAAFQERGGEFRSIIPGSSRALRF